MQNTVVSQVFFRYHNFNMIEYTEIFYQRIIHMFDMHMPIKIFINH